VTEEMFGGQHRTDEAETARAGWVTQMKQGSPTQTRFACYRKGVFVDSKNKNKTS